MHALSAVPAPPPDFWADTMRWWSSGGAFLALALVGIGLWRQFQLWHVHPAGVTEVPSLRLLIEKFGLMMFLLFAAIAGTLIPASSRWDIFAAFMADFRVMAIAWTLVGIGCWASALAFASGRWFIASAAATWLIAVTFAVTATSGA